MAAITDQRAKQLYGFGPFRVDADKELLLRGDETVPLTPKTFQILLVLIRKKKEVVAKDELLKAVWPDTFVEEANLSRNIFLLRKALGESPQDHRYIVTVPGRGYRFAEDVQLVPDQELNIVAASHSNVEVQVEETRPWGWMAAAAVLLIAVATGAWRLLLYKAPVLTEKDTIILADFTNSTSDPVFDDTLRQGLAVDLEQSPFLSLIPDERIERTLQLMGQSPHGRITARIANDLCVRTGSAAYLTGSIANFGSEYVLGLKAVSCATGDVLADEQEKASSKEAVLSALDRTAIKLRKTLGESLRTVEKFDTPLEQATTPSLEALQAYTLGRRTQAGKNEFPSAIPFYERAIRFDAKFAIAYAALGSTYWNIGETVLGSEYAKRAFELHASISEPERFYVDSTYYHYVVGNLDKARQVYEVWAQTYPRSSSARIRLWQLYSEEGRYEDALPEIREALRLDPWKGLTSMDLVGGLISLGRLQEAGTTAQQAIANGHDSSGLRLRLYRLAFLANDGPDMVRQAERIARIQDSEHFVLEQQAETAAYYGHLRESRILSQRAAESAIRTGKREIATTYEANAALREALFGTAGKLRPGHSAGEIQTGRRAQYVMAMSFALAGDSSSAERLIEDLVRRFPEDTLVQFNFCPAIRAQIALNHNDPSKALELLQPAGVYELTESISSQRFLGPIYIRGEAYLMAHRGAEAAAEFKKILDHRGVVLNSPSGALAHLQLGRANVVSGDKDKARMAYRDFFTLWKDADPDIPILKQARNEYAKLK